MAPSAKMLSLKQFMYRQQITRLYRSDLRVANTAPPHAIPDLVAEIRAEFDREQGEEPDERRQQYLVATGKARVDELKAMLGYEVLGSLEARTGASFKPGAF